MSDKSSYNKILIKLFKKKMSDITDDNMKRRFLIICAESHRLIKTDEPSYVDINNSDDESQICKICKTDTIYYSNHEAICNNCGTVKPNQGINPFQQYKHNLSDGKGTFITKGDIIVKVNKDGKDVNRDLAQVNTWVSKTTEETKLDKIMLYMEDKLDILNITDTSKIIIRDIWKILYMDKSIKLKGDFKKIIGARCVFRTISNTGRYSRQEISSIFGITDSFSMSGGVDDIINKSLTKAGYIPSLYSGFTLDQSVKRDFIRDLIGDNKELYTQYNHFKAHLEKNEYKTNFNDNYGIVYIIAKKIGKTKYTLEYINSFSNVSKTTILNSSNKFIKEYEKVYS